MTDPVHSRHRDRSPRSYRRSPNREDSRRRRSRESHRDRGYERSEWRRADTDIPDRKDDRDVQQQAKSEPKAPRGFPDGCSWGRGDWICPRPGCEGYVTRAKFDRCTNCGRAQPFFKVLMELAKNDKFRTELCTQSGCKGRDCPHAHSECELRSFDKSRVYKRGDPPPSAAVPMTPAETDAFTARWDLREPALSILTRLPEQLSELVQRSYFVEGPETDTTGMFLKCLADLIRPRRRECRRPDQLLGYLSDILRRNNAPTGLACSPTGTFVLTLEKDVLVVPLPEFSDEHALGLLAFAMTFNGLTVVHSCADMDNLRKHFAKLYVDLCESRIRRVDNPSELLYVATDETDASIDRAVQARLDALNPNPLLPTP